MEKMKKIIVFAEMLFKEGTSKLNSGKKDNNVTNVMRK